VPKTRKKGEEVWYQNGMGRCGAIGLKFGHSIVLPKAFLETQPQAYRPTPSCIEMLRKLALFSSFFVSVEGRWGFGEPGSGEIL